MPELLDRLVPRPGSLQLVRLPIAMPARQGSSCSTPNGYPERGPTGSTTRLSRRFDPRISAIQGALRSNSDDDPEALTFMEPTALMLSRQPCSLLLAASHSRNPTGLFPVTSPFPIPELSMTLEKLTSLQDSSPDSNSSGRRPLPALLLPIGLLIAFIIIFGLMFGSRLLPATEVTTAPVVALRLNSGEDELQPSSSPEKMEVNRDLLLFQASGWVEPDPYTINVPALINGVVKDVLVLEGQHVKKDDILATLIDDEAQLDVQHATQSIATLDATKIAHCAQIPILNAEMQAAQKKIESAKALHAELLDVATRLASVPAGSVSDREVRQAQLKVEAQSAVIDEATADLSGVIAQINKVNLEELSVNARIRVAQTELSRKELALERTVIRAPIDGIILHLHAQPGKKRMLASDDPKSSVIVELYDPEKLQARIDVPLSEAASLQIGQPVTLTTDLLPDTLFTGEVTRIVGEADLQRNTLQTKVRFNQPDPRLRPAMLVRAAFHPGGNTKDGPLDGSGAAQNLALFVRVDSLFDRSQKSARVWFVEGDRLRVRTLTLGSDQREGHIQVIEGLRPGDQVVLPPFDDLEENQRIKLTTSP